ncbi:hypothetical protein HPP92_018169 [Vanilla planifolia]|uniref:Eukaryotic translation initiation factor 3 subunit G N-terminal domain-containing protein n=1 Tax=Vanilla planifolia TaxID=51239 RepID=A0A835QBI0_VANPL|nr:hypothetical protein HPP92_018169 [Vanilla planifolia]
MAADVGRTPVSKTVIGPDENGVKKVVEYKFNDDGNKVKITTTTRTRKAGRARFSANALWSADRGASLGMLHKRMPVAASTMVSTEEIILERPRALLKVQFILKSKVEEPKAAGTRLLQWGKPGAVLMVCRTCGKKGDHWTSKCPYKDLAQPADSFIDKPQLPMAHRLLLPRAPMFRQA